MRITISNDKILQMKQYTEIETHVGDFKQLPPATTQPPFICLTSVYTSFDFRVLRENRRVRLGEARAAESNDFHAALGDIAWGCTTERVKRLVIEAYVRGARIGCAEKAELEGSTSVFTKRRYRDGWNRTLVRRIAKTHNHSLKVKGRVRSQGARGNAWFSDGRTQMARRRSRTQALWNLHIAGDWHSGFENMNAAVRPHMMRAMLVSNIDVDQRFANGTQGRLMYWVPEKNQRGKALYSSHPELSVRFVKEASLQKREMFPDIDHADVPARHETLASVQGQPVLLQIPLVPSYALTVHKTQALSIKHIVRGCLEGVLSLADLKTGAITIAVGFSFWKQCALSSAFARNC